MSSPSLMSVVPLRDHLAVGSYEAALNPPDEISALLCVAEEHDLPVTDRCAHKVPMVDMQPIPADQLEEAVRWIDAHIDDYSILLYCNAGVGRSPSVAVAYLCCYHGYSFGEAVEYVARRKPNVSTLPNLIESIEEVWARLD